MRRLLVLIAATACGPRAEDVPLLRGDHCPVGGCSDAGSGADAGVANIPPEPLEPWDETGAGPLSGIFIVETQIRAQVVIEIETRQLFRLRMVQRGRDIQQSVSLCAFRLPSVEGVAELSVPPALGEVLRKKPVLSSGPFLSNDLVLGASYTPPPAVIVLGADLNDVTAPLPTAEDPSLAVDEDEDGHPGVTILAQALTCAVTEELYVALRSRSALTGTVKSFDHMEGTADVDLDQSVLGQSDECLAAAAGLDIQILPGSPFTAVRSASADDLDANGNVSCPEIRLRAPERFGDFWR